MSEEKIKSIGKVAITPKGEYNSATKYEKLDLVTSEGSSYISKQNNNINNAPIGGENDEYWQKIAAKGDQGDAGSDSIAITGVNYVIGVTDNPLNRPNEWRSLGNAIPNTWPGNYTWIKTNIQTENQGDFDILSIGYIARDGKDSDANVLWNSLRGYVNNYIQTKTVSVKAPFYYSENNPCSMDDTKMQLRIFFDLEPTDTFLSVPEIIFPKYAYYCNISNINTESGADNNFTVITGENTTDTIQKKPYVQLYINNQYNGNYLTWDKCDKNNTEITIQILYKHIPMVSSDQETPEESESESESTP